jgi:hypothetical protein
VSAAGGLRLIDVADRLVAGHSASGGRSRLLAVLVGFITGCLGVAGVLFVLK